ncbi:MAG: MATE family efflux transporter [Prevotella sp.]|jgi:MATE family multidrug resistance protein
MRSTDRQILSLAIPSIVQNITVPLLGLVDLTIVGHFGSASAIGAIAVGSMIFNVIYWLLGFLRMGTSGLTSQAYGRGDIIDARRLLKRALTLALLLGLTFLLLQQPLGWAALRIIHPSSEVLPLANIYFDVCIWGAPAVLGLYSLNGWFIGLQDTRTPLFVAIFQNLLNILASLIFVYLLNLDITGVALGTLTAQWAGFLLSVSLALKRSKSLETKITPTQATKTKITGWGEFFSVNRDIFFRTVFLVGVNLFFTSAGARQGDVILSVNTLLLTFYTLFSYVMDGFAFAGEALCGSAYGSEDDKRFRQIVNRLFHWGEIMTASFTLLYLIGGQPLMHLITSEPHVLNVARTYFPWALLIPITGMAAFVYDGIFIGITQTRGMLISSCSAAIVFLLIFISGKSLGFSTNHLLWFSFIAFLSTRGIVQYIIMRRIGQH